jgi:hypothetical protein
MIPFNLAIGLGMIWGGQDMTDAFLFQILAQSITDQARYGGGSGTVSDPYQIWTAEQMNQIGANIDDWDKHFILMTDIDMGSLAGTNFNIIGTVGPDGRPFAGVFDGNGKTIANLTCIQPGTTHLGLFGVVVEDAVIKNLRLEGAVVDAGTGSAHVSVSVYSGGGLIA